MRVMNFNQEIIGIEVSRGCPDLRSGHGATAASRNPARGESGFTLLEILIAIVILSIGILGTGVLATNTLRSNQAAQHVTAATTLIQDKMEEFKNMTFANIVTGADPTTINAKGMPNGNYTRSWTVTQTGNLKSITVTVTWPYGGVIKSRTMLTVVSQF